MKRSVIIWHQPSPTKTSCISYRQIHSKFTQPKFEPPTSFFHGSPSWPPRRFTTFCRNLPFLDKSKVMSESCVTTVKPRSGKKITWHLNFTQQKSHNTLWESWNYQFRTNFSFRSFLNTAVKIQADLTLLVLPGKPTLKVEKQMSHIPAGKERDPYNGLS